jgi:sulfonate transport system substrate-binding protein
VAVYRGTADQLAFDRALQTVGLSERNMQVINLDWSAGKAALAAGRVDAVWGGVSLLALRGDKIDVVVKSGDSGRQNTTQAGFLATQDFIQTWPQATQQIIDVLVKNAAEISDPANREPGRQRWRSRVKSHRRCSLRSCSHRISTSALRRASTPS